MAKRNWALMYDVFTPDNERWVELLEYKPTKQDMYARLCCVIDDQPGLEGEEEFYLSLSRPRHVKDGEGRKGTHPLFCAEGCNLEQGNTVTNINLSGTFRVKTTVKGKTLGSFVHCPTERDIEKLFDSDDHNHETEFLVFNKGLREEWKVCPSCRSAYQGKNPCDLSIYEYDTTCGTQYEYSCNSNEGSPLDVDWAKVKSLSLTDVNGKPLCIKWFLEMSTENLEEFRRVSKGKVVKRVKPLNLTGMRDE